MNHLQTKAAGREPIAIRDYIGKSRTFHNGHGRFFMCKGLGTVVDEAVLASVSTQPSAHVFYGITSLCPRRQFIYRIMAVFTSIPLPSLLVHAQPYLSLGGTMAMAPQVRGTWLITRADGKKRGYERHKRGTTYLHPPTHTHFSPSGEGSPLFPQHLGPIL